MLSKRPFSRPNQLRITHKYFINVKRSLQEVEYETRTLLGINDIALGGFGLTNLTTESLRVDPASWAFVELGQTDLGDPRRTHRLLQLASALVANPTCSLPGACKTWANTKGAYRFLENDDIEPEAILAGHRRSTLQRIGEHPMILAVQDTTSYSFTSHRATRGLGPIAGRIPGTDIYPMGFHVHSCLAVTPEGVPLGLLGHKLWVRPVMESKSTETEQLFSGNPAENDTEVKESVCWEEMLRMSTQGIPAGTKVLTVGDRGADIYDFFVSAVRLQQDVLVRASRKRQVTAEKEFLWDLVRKVEAVGQMVIEVPRGDDRPSRAATLELRTAKVRLRRPSSARTQEAVRVILSAVVAQEIDPPAGQEAVHWTLLTTLPVTTAEDAANCVRWYTKRWTIERYHYTLKSGCEVEELQLETLERLHRALAVYSAVAWRLLYLTYLARKEPESPCTRFLSASEWGALYCQAHRTTKLPNTPSTLREAVLWIAKLGGFLARKRDGNPGVKVLWQGYRRLQDMVVMYDILRPTQPTN